MSKFRFVAIHPSRVDERKKIGPASFLHDFLVDRQTNAEGKVNYGKAISYAWIRARWPEAPPIRTLKRHMARLKAAGRVTVRKLPFGDGMLVRILGSAKWAQEAAQMKLFPPPEIVSISGGRPVEKQWKSAAPIGPKVAPLWGQKWPYKEVKNLREEKNNCRSARSARASPVEDAAALEERRRLLADQAQILQAKYRTSG